MTQIKKGDKLRVLSTPHGNLTIGEIVTAACDQRYDMIDIEKNGNTKDHRGYFARRFEIIPQDVEFEGFKVGDKVEVIYGGAGVSSRDMGKIATVIAVNPKADFYSKLTIDGEDFSYISYDNKRAINCATKSVKKINTIDFTKPVFTAEGTPVEILTTAGRDPKFPVLGYEGKATQTSKFTLGGISSLGVARRNLTNQAPKIETVQFHNVYKGSDGKLYTGAGQATAEKAKGNASKDAVGLVKVTLVEGKFDN